MIQCRFCNSDNINRCGKDSKTGKQRYICKDCHKKFVLDPQPTNYNRYEKICPKCGHSLARKAGKIKESQYYQCLNCKHKFLENNKFKWTTDTDKDNIITLRNEGKTITEICKLTGLSPKTISKVLKEKFDLIKLPKTKQELTVELIKTLSLSGASIKEICAKSGYTPSGVYNILRKISPEQKALIIHFGVGCAVPAEYIAPYIPCSVKLVNDILSKYKIPKRKQYILTEKEKLDDRMTLEAFLS